MDEWLKFWNDRYSSETYGFGVEPNKYLEDKLKELPKGKILFPAEGEGRNAVFAAKLGWDVSAFDISEQGKKKALRLAENNRVSIDYKVGDARDIGCEVGQFDAIALIYAHFPIDIRRECHKALNACLRKNGVIIFEAFSKNHLEYRSKNEKVGGPSNLDGLFSKDEITTDFSGFEFIELEEKIIDLKEGIYHNGRGAVIRFVGRKK